MAHQATGILSKIDHLELQLKSVREAATDLRQLEGRFQQITSQIPIDPHASANFKRDLEQSRLKYAQLDDLTLEPSLKEMTLLVRSGLEQLHAASQISFQQIPDAPEDPRTLLLDIAEKIKRHRTAEALQDFSNFAKQFPKLAGQVYGNLWNLKGSPIDLHPNYGHRAFHNLDGFSSQDNEKAEAIILLYSSVEERLNKCADLLSGGHIDEAMAQFKELESLYPKAIDSVFGKTWVVYGKPTRETRPDIAHDNFGRLAFFGSHQKLKIEPGKQVEAIRLAIPEIKQRLADTKFCSEQNKMRRDVRCVAVIGEQLEVLKQGFYIAPSGQKRDISSQIQLSIQQTKPCKDGGTTDRKKARFEKTIFEVRPQNCVTLAYDLASDKSSKVNVMNFANNVVSGGAYKHHAGSQEEELFRCTSLPLALDQEHGAQPTNFYPIHRVAGQGGGLYTPSTPLFRSGLATDYKLLEEPVSISVGTFAAFESPPLDYTKPHDPRLQSDAAHWTKEKIRTYLKACYDNGDDTLIVGAFGCGAFANPPGHIAEMFMDVIQKEYPNCFKKIVFAVLKDGAEGHKHNPQGNFIPFARIVQQQGGIAYGIKGETLKAFQ
ncbi:MAG: TIGR02452 family protein [Verrucomicrobia bacterium]|nr:TIGR02452 family protein [Verrucomicrobiota bacterium]